MSMAAMRGPRLAGAQPKSQVPPTAPPLSASPSETLEKLDQYGGYKAIPVPGGATGYYRVGKLGSRVIFATPEGNAFWMRAAYLVDSRPPAVWWTTWAPATVRRMREWGFNTIGEYSTNYAWPVETYSRGWANPEKMPFIYLWNGSRRAASARVANVIDVDFGRFPKLWRGQMRDVFDPNFETAFRTPPTEFTRPLTSSPWLIGTTIDDADYTHGLKNIGHAHIGWVVAVGKPNYSKAALRDVLKAKYLTIAALNAAWGSSYTSFESDGGWPNGKGLLDESGRGTWIGADAWNLSTAHAPVKADLSAFLELFADKYFSVAAKAVRSYAPNNLVFGPAALGVATHAEVLRAAGRHLDALQVFASSNNELWANAVRAYSLSGRPLFVWKTLTAQKDSAIKNQPADTGWEDYPSQADRGRAYEAFLRRLLATPGIVGLDWWAWVDKTSQGENSNFGLVSTLDKPYEPFVASVTSAHQMIPTLLKQPTP